MNSVWSNTQIMKYQRFTPLGCKYIEIRKFELWQILNSFKIFVFSSIVTDGRTVISVRQDSETRSRWNILHHLIRTVILCKTISLCRTVYIEPVVYVEQLVYAELLVYVESLAYVEFLVYIELSVYVELLVYVEPLV